MDKLNLLSKITNKFQVFILQIESIKVILYLLFPVYTLVQRIAPKNDFSDKNHAIPMPSCSEHPSPELTLGKDVIPKPDEHQDPPILHPEVQEQHVLDVPDDPPPLLPPRRVTRSSTCSLAV